MSKFNLKDKVYCIRDRRVAKGIVVMKQTTQWDSEEEATNPPRYLVDFCDMTLTRFPSNPSQTFANNPNHIYAERELSTTKQELLDSL
jgi:hypothetical protein